MVVSRGFSFFEIAIDFSGRSVNEWFPPWKQPLNESGRGFFLWEMSVFGYPSGFFKGAYGLDWRVHWYSGLPEAALHSCLESRCVKGGLGGRSKLRIMKSKVPTGATIVTIVQKERGSNPSRPIFSTQKPCFGKVLQFFKSPYRIL